MGRAALRSLPAGLSVDEQQGELQCTKSQQDTQNRSVPHSVLKKQCGSQHQARMRPCLLVQGVFCCVGLSATLEHVHHILKELEANHRMGFDVCRPCIHILSDSACHKVLLPR